MEALSRLLHAAEVGDQAAFAQELSAELALLQQLAQNLLLAAGITAFALMPGDARHREVLEQVRKLLAADRLTDAHILLEVATGLPDDDELRGLRRLASGIIPVRITCDRGGVRITATPFDEYTEFGEPTELGIASTEGILDASLRIGRYRLSVVSAGFGSAEVVVEVPARHQHPGVRVNVRETRPMLVGMQLIPTQTYTLGFTPSETLVPFELESRLVQLPAFYIDKYEVRNSEYARFVAATGGARLGPTACCNPRPKTCRSSGSPGPRRTASPSG